MTTLFQLRQGGQVHPGEPDPGQDGPAGDEAPPLMQVPADSLGHQPA